MYVVSGATDLFECVNMCTHVGDCMCVYMCVYTRSHNNTLQHAIPSVNSIDHTMQLKLRAGSFTAILSTKVHASE